MSENLERRSRKSLVGVVVGKSGDKTVKVSCSYKRPHSVYGKEIKRKTVVHVHDEKNECQVGDNVRAIETRPLSRTKRWRLESVLSSSSFEE